MIVRFAHLSHAARAHRNRPERRRPDETTLWEHLETFVAQAEARIDTGLPAFVRDEFKASLESGILARGFSLHAGVHCSEHQRKGLERLCRYITRPAIANERLKWDGAGNVVPQLKSPWRDSEGANQLKPLARGVLQSNSKTRNQPISLS